MSDIAINPVTRRVQFTGNTGTGPYAFTFNVLQSSDIVVYKNNVLLTETTDYTVSIAANGTGNITMVVALVLTDILTIIGGRELSRTTDFVTAGDLLASSLNEQLDSNVIMSQQLDERFGRTLAVPPGDEDKTLDLPLAADRADKIILFDDTGNVTAAAPSDFFGNAILGGNFIVNTATGDGSQTAFGLTVAPGVKTNIQIHIDGVYQNKSTFSLSGSTVTFTEAPPLNAAIEFMMGESVTTITGDSSAITYNQGGTGAQDRTVRGKLQEGVSVADFGAVGDGVADDTTAFQAAIDYCKTSGFVLHINPGTYKLSDTLDLNDGYQNAVSLLGMGGASNEPTLKFTSSVDIGLLIKNSKATMLRDFKVNMEDVTVNCVAILANGMWESQFHNIEVIGPSSGDPSSGQNAYGIALRPTYNGTVTSHAAAVDLEAIEGAQGINMGVYWSQFTRLRVYNFSYGLIMLGGEGGTNPRTNQNQFNSCNFNANYYDIWMEGIGGGNVFISSTAEGAGGDAVTVQNISSGTGPVWIGGEVSATGDKWIGPGMLLNAVAGTDFPIANTAGEKGTHIRFTDQTPQLYGTKLIGSTFLSDWDTKQDAPTSGSGTTSSKTFDMATISADGSGTDAIGFEFSVILTDNGSPQGTSVMIYHILCNRAIGQSLTAGAVEISERSQWYNLGGGSVAPTVTISVVGTLATVTANVNWDGAGSDPGEAVCNYNIRKLNEVDPDGWTLTAL
jgi:hypothetical protein